MMNFFNKNRKVITAVIAIVVVLAMVIPTIISVLL